MAHKRIRVQGELRAVHLYEATGDIDVPKSN